MKSTRSNFEKSGRTKANFVVGQTTIIKSTLSNFEKSGRAKANFVVGQTTIIESTPSNFDKSGRAKANFVAGQTTISLVLVALVHGVVPIGIVLIALQYTSTGACMLSSKVSSKK